MNGWKTYPHLFPFLFKPQKEKLMNGWKTHTHLFPFLFKPQKEKLMNGWKTQTHLFPFLFSSFSSSKKTQQSRFKSLLKDLGIH